METSKKVSIFWCGKAMIGGAAGFEHAIPRDWSMDRELD